MVILSFLTPFLEIAVFFFAATAFVLAVRFFKDSRKRLRETFPGIIGPCKQLAFGLDRSGFIIPKGAAKKAETKAFQQPSQHPPSDHTKEDIKALRLQLQQQQQELTKALKQISYLSENVSSAERRPMPGTKTHKHLEQQQWATQEDAASEQLKAQDSYTQKLQDRLENVHTEFEKLQDKMLQMEQQAWQAAELSLQLEHAEQMQAQMEKTLAKKEEKIRELNFENQRLHRAVSELEDKIEESDLQRQQLLKKVQLLEGLNADMMDMAETNRKLKAQITRMAELESMLQMMMGGRENR